MKKYMIALVVGLGLFVAGCATKPSYVGTWKCPNMPEDAQEAGVTAANLYITEEGGFSGAFEKTDGTTMGGFSGSWETNDVGGINFLVNEGNGPEKGTGQLIDKDTLLGVGDGVAMKFIRQ